MIITDPSLSVAVLLALQHDLGHSWKKLLIAYKPSGLFFF